MNSRRDRWLQLQRAMWLLAVVATVSTVITLILGDSLIWIRSVAEPNSKQVASLSSHFPETDSHSREYEEKHEVAESKFKPDWHSLQKLYNKISEVEKLTQHVGFVVVTGLLPSAKQHLLLIQAAFRKYKMEVLDQVYHHDMSPWAWGNDSSLVFCLNRPKKDNCVLSFVPLANQKVNFITGLTELLTSPNLLCHLTDDRHTNKKFGQWYGRRAPCYILDYKDEAISINCNNKSGWWVINKSDDLISRQYIPCSTDPRPLVDLEYRKNKGILVPLPKNLMTIDGADPLVWQVEVLITSLKPARVYIHSSGLVWASLQDFINLKHNKNVLLTELHQLITEMDSRNTADLTLARLKSAIMEVVRFLEKHISDTSQNQRICQNCFQLLAFVLMFDSTFRPIILQVIPSHYSENLTSLSDYLLEQNLIEDLAAMLVSRESTSVDLVRALVDLGITHFMDDKICSQDGSICVEQEQISYLLDTRREQRTTRNWIRLFPSTSETCLNIHQSSSTLQNGQFSSQKPNGTFEKLILSIEEYFLCPSLIKDKVTISGLDLALHGHRDGNDIEDVDNDDGNDDDSDGSSVPKLSNLSDLLLDNCSTDNSSLPYLSAIHTDPYVQLYPEFSPLVTEYQAYVDYQTTVIQVWGVTKHCRTQVKLNDKHNNDRLSNFSLSLGENTAYFLVVVMDHLEPYVLNGYRVNIIRKKLNEGLGKFPHLKEQLSVCSLKQDCWLPFSPYSSCGLQDVFHLLNWNGFLRYHHDLPTCYSGNMTGEWMVPCTDCHNKSSCYWREAVWQPSGCKERELSADELKSCLAGKKVLFIGDSTNRGILHYILEKLNGSLMQWNKTHSICVYPDLNNGQTMFAFAYYPQFWLMSRSRPLFNDTLYDLFNKTSDWSGKETVIVIGGVHWLAKHHLDLIAEGLQREGLTNKSKVIVKGLGAGFHQPVSGLHQLSLKDHQQLYNHNQAVLSYAHQLGYSTVDTFTMTMSRYKDFLQGNCACHFHQVSPVRPSVKRKLSWKYSAVVENNQKFQVEGDINSVYSRMVMNRICVDKGG